MRHRPRVALAVFGLAVAATFTFAACSSTDAPTEADADGGQSRAAAGDAGDAGGSRGSSPSVGHSSGNGAGVTVGSSGTSGNAGASKAGGSGETGRAEAGSSATGASGGTREVEVAPGAACPALKLERAVTVANFDTDRVSYFDANCQPRTAALMRVGGGSVRQASYAVDGKPRVMTGTGVNGHTGWGYTVNHWGNAATVGNGVAGTFGPLFTGKHHAVYQYQFSVPINGKSVPVTQQWFFSTGRSNPVLATTYDMTQFAPGALGADIRTPYGDLAWDGDDNAASTVVSGVGWGDHYKFVTTSGPLTMDSTWDYTQENSVPYVLEWADASDAEMGAVQTQTYTQHDAGGYWLFGNWGKTSANQSKNDGQIGNMPVTWNWTYQLDQYELCIEDPACLHNTTSSHRLAWGMNYGALGGATTGSGAYSGYGHGEANLTGYPYQSYSVFMVLGKHSGKGVFEQVSEVEAVQEASLAASVGAVTTMAPGGVGRSDAVALSPPGFDARYAVWSVQAADNHVKLVVTAPKVLKSPVLVISAFTGTKEPSVTVDGKLETADVDYLLSLDSAQQKVWVTFRSSWSNSVQIEVQ